MLNIEDLRKAKKKYLEAKKDYLTDIKEWEIRAREICQLYFQLSGECEVYSNDKVTLKFSKNAVGIFVTDFEEDEMVDYTVAIDDFIADDFATRLTEKFYENKKQEEEKKQKEIEDTERAELERLKAKYGE